MPFTPRKKLLRQALFNARTALFCGAILLGDFAHNANIRAAEPSPDNRSDRPGVGNQMAPGDQEPMSEERYEREELGVNKFTAPSIGDLFAELDQLRPLPFDQLWRELPGSGPAGREQQAMIFGQLVADGFLIVEAQKANLIDDLGRVLIRQARGLGVAERVIKHSASLSELGRKGQWGEVRNELVATQNDVEQTMIEMRDQTMAHLISLGGWLRGLEIGAAAVQARYSTERSAVLVQPKVTGYFGDELKTLPPRISHDALFEHVRGGVKAIDAVIAKATGGTLRPEEVKAIGDEARDLNLEIAHPR